MDDFVNQINKIENLLKICKDDDKYIIARELAFYIRILQSVESEYSPKLIERIRGIQTEITIKEK